ncbi:MAG TPA: hypothetical protein VN809_13335 [Telmatospirillum sp.]|nr:hypothetical protein [Telmatospirillum sp.]
MKPSQLLLSLAHGVLRRHDKGLQRSEKFMFAALEAETARLSKDVQPAPTGRNLVMGMATNFNKETIAPFVLSLRDNGYAGDIILLVSKPDEETALFYRRQKVITKFYWDAHFIQVERQMARYFSFFRVLRELCDQGCVYDQVLIADTRDVVFQADPFASAHRVDIAAFNEEETMTIGRCPFNGRWVREGYGAAVFREMAARPISNVGTVMGSGLGIMRYLLLLQAEAFRVAAPARNRLGVDQVAHNRLLVLNSISSFANGDHIWTLGYVPPEKVVLTPDHKIADVHGRVCPIVHQYDRHPQLKAFVAALYGERHKTASVR